MINHSIFALKSPSILTNKQFYYCIEVANYILINHSINAFNLPTILINNSIFVLKSPTIYIDQQLYFCIEIANYIYIDQPFYYLMRWNHNYFDQPFYYFIEITNYIYRLTIPLYRTESPNILIKDSIFALHQLGEPGHVDLLVSALSISVTWLRIDKMVYQYIWWLQCKNRMVDHYNWWFQYNIITWIIIKRT